jgi:hypothetical protein
MSDSTKVSQKMASDLQEEMEGLEFIIFDEFSMLGAKHLGIIQDKFTKSQRDEAKRQLPFGGRHVIFSGASIGLN